jgi:hypothetical protein
MVRKSLGLGVACAAFLVFGSSQAFAACSNASLKGTYGVQISGQNKSKMPVVGLYLLKANGAGKITGTGIQNQGSGAVSKPVTATYKVTAACTGTIQSAGDTLAFVLDNANASLQIIQTGSGDGTTAGAGFLQGTVPCNPSGLSGTFGGAGIIPGTATGKETAIVGQTTYNGKGSATGAGVVNASGTILATKSTVTYTVSPACFIAATIKTTVSSGATVVATSTTHNAGLLVSNGSELLTISTDPGSVSSGRLQK